MQLVATSDFRNPDPEKIDVGSDKIHDLHIHKGARFDIGGDLPFEKLTGQQKRLVVELNSAGRIVEAAQKDKVAAIDKEVSEEEKRAAKLKEKEAGAAAAKK